jgi:hypothetical protein
MPKAVSHQNDQNKGIEGQTNGKSKGKPEKTSVCSQTFFSTLERFLNELNYTASVLTSYIWWCMYAYLWMFWMQGVVRKRGKTAGGKPQAPKKVRKKNQVSKKAKTKK